jgi:hypothetical protein
MIGEGQLLLSVAHGPHLFNRHSSCSFRSEESADDLAHGSQHRLVIGVLGDFGHVLHVAGHAVPAHHED